MKWQLKRKKWQFRLWKKEPAWKKKLLLAAPFAAAGAGLCAALAVERVRKNRFRGKVVLVTGGSRGLGLALARQFAADGCRVAICGRDEKSLDSARRILQAEGARVFTAVCDVSDKRQVDRMIEAVREHYGRIDVLVNNAGVIQVAPLENLDLDDFERAMGTMFWGVVYPTLAVLPEMRERGEGHIATVTSVGGKVSIPHLLPYSCAKFAAVGFCEGLRAEVAQYGVKVTTIVPGLMRTGSYRHADFGGAAQREAGWFGLAASAPLLSVSTESAARKIVCAIRRGKAVRTITPQAALLAAAHGVMPGVVIDTMALVNRALPNPTEARRTKPGTAIEDDLPAWWKAATALGRRAGTHLNQ